MPNPDTGNSGIFSANNRISMMPSQNDGMPIPISGIVRIALSPRLFGLLAAHIAKGTQMITENSAPATISQIVGCRLSPINSVTGTPVY